MTPSVRMWVSVVVLLAVSVAASLPGEVTDRPQASFRPGGFAVIDGPEGAREVTELDQGGNRLRSVIAPIPERSRVVGFKDATGLVWTENAKIHVGAITKDGSFVKGDRPFGTKVDLLCDGVASTAKRFAVGWIESTGDYWFVHGPGPSGKALEAVSVATATHETTWCAMTPAGKQLALVWRMQDLLVHNVCDRRCGMPSKFDLPLAGRDVLGVGCIDGACAVATGSDDGAGVGWYTRTGKQRWAKPLPDARRGAKAALHGAAQHVVIAYETTDGGLAIVRMGKSGELNELWRGRGDAPTLAWEGGSLFLGYRDARGHLGTIVLSVPS